MFKKLLILIAVVIVAISVAIYGYFDIIIKDAIEKYGSRILGVQISVNKVSTSFASSAIKITDIKISNPNGFKNKDIFELKQIDVSLDIHSVLTQVINIHNITISEPSVYYELGQNGNNITAFKNNMNKRVEEHNNNVDAKKIDKSDSALNKKVMIGKFNMNSGKINANVEGMGNKSLNLPSFELKNIGADKNGVTVADASQQVIGELVRVVSQANLSELVGNVGAVTSRLKDFQNDLKTEPKEAGKNLLNGLFGNK